MQTSVLSVGNGHVGIELLAPFLQAWSSHECDVPPVFSLVPQGKNAELPMQCSAGWGRREGDTGHSGGSMSGSLNCLPWVQQAENLGKQ